MRPIAIEEMRQRLQPKGSLPLVRLSLRNHGFVEHGLIVKALDELERASRNLALGQEPTALERLAAMLLYDSCTKE